MEAFVQLKDRQRELRALKERQAQLQKQQQVVMSANTNARSRVMIFAIDIDYVDATDVKIDPPLPPPECQSAVHMHLYTWLCCWQGLHSEKQSAINKKAGADLDVEELLDLIRRKHENQAREPLLMSAETAIDIADLGSCT